MDITTTVAAGDEEDQKQIPDVTILLSDLQREVSELRDRTDSHATKIDSYGSKIDIQQCDLLDRIISLEEATNPKFHEVLLDRILSLDESNLETQTKLYNLEAANSELQEEKNQMQEDIKQLQQDVSRGGASVGGVISTNPVNIFRRNIIDHDGLPTDTFSLMMASSIQSKPWLLGIFTFVFQMILILMILADQLKESKDSSAFNVPFKVDPVVRVGQLFAIIFALLTQHDIISSIRFLVMFWKDPQWDKTVLRRDNDDAPKPTPMEWVVHILIPNVLKFCQGILVIFATFVVIVQSDNIIDLLKEFTALMILSETDNIFFGIAANGYLGSKLQKNTAEVREIKVQNESFYTSASNSSINLPSPPPSASNGSTYKDYLRPGILLCIVMAMVGSWLNIVTKQVNGTYFHQRYPHCNMPDAFALATVHFGDGKCYGGQLNTLDCAFEDGDCINFNLAFPLCKGDDRTDVENRLGDGQCDAIFMNTDCDFDGGDCCPYEIMNDPSFGDGQCNGGIQSTARCGYDNNDCNQLRISYPECPFEDLREITGAAKLVLGDGLCNSGVYNMKECGYKFGDCSQGQIGQTILITDDVESSSGLYFSMMLSLDGMTMAMGLYWTDADGLIPYDSPGVVKVWRYSNDKKMWLRLGRDMVGPGLNEDGDEFGRQLSMSASGDLIAISSKAGLQVFGFNNTSGGDEEWGQVGQTLVSIVPGIFSYSHGIISADGLRLALVYNSKEIRIYNIRPSLGGQRWVNEDHDIIFPGIINETLNVTLKFDSTDSSRLLFSDIGTEQVKVFQRITTNLDTTWTQIGQDIERYPSSPSSMAIGAGGNRIAVHIKSSDATSSSNVLGKVQVFDYDVTNNKWLPLGSPLQSQSTVDDHYYYYYEFGYNIEMSSDGNLLLVGMNHPDCLFSELPSGILRGPNEFEIQKCLTLTGPSFELYIYQPKTHQFIPTPVKEDKVDSNAMPDSILHGLHFSMGSIGNKTLLSICNYNLDDKVVFIEMYDLDELYYTKCAVDYPEYLGDGNCQDLAPYNSEVCEFDGGDCTPMAVEGYPGCFVYDTWVIGDGLCTDFPPYNTAVCGLDGGDCVVSNLTSVDGYPECFVHFPDLIGNRICQDWPPYNTPDCGFDGGDCSSAPKPVKGYPTCLVPYPGSIGNGHCFDEPPYNTEVCGFDGGDCDVKPVFGLSDCFVHDPGLIGNGWCEDVPPYNTEACGFDGGDCHPISVDGYLNCLLLSNYHDRIGDGECNDFPPYNTEACGFDGGDCLPQPVEGYPDCLLLSQDHKKISDGECNNIPPYYTPDCGFDGGDCIPSPVDGYPECLLLPENHNSIGDGECNDFQPYNTVDCGYDGGDCLPQPVDGYPNCLVLLNLHSSIGDGVCSDFPPYNTPDCGYDGGDCLPRRVNGYPNCLAILEYHQTIGDGLCTDFPPYNTPDCGFDGGDCILKPVDGYPDCLILSQNHKLIGNGLCTDFSPYNTPDCGFDGGDCILKPVERYPDCFVYLPQWISDGYCSDFSPYNTPECGYDGGDCAGDLKPVEGYPECFVHRPNWITDGFCIDWPPYNTPECGYDGGDCNHQPIEGYPECFVAYPGSIGNGYCHDIAPYNTKACGFDDGDCL